MKLEEYASFDALGLAELVRQREVTARELCESMLEGVDMVNERLNAVVAILPDRVPVQDAEFSGSFTGVPFLIDDFPMEAGVPAEMGCLLADGLTPDHDQEVMVRFRRSGLINLGRSTTSELGLAAVTTSRARGATRNPWDLGRSTAGSCGGAAAMVAAGVVPLAHGMDGGGSIRTPASHCGLIGFKPSRGRVSSGPDAGEIASGLVSHFALTKSVRDTAALMDAIAGPAPGDPYVIPRPSMPYLEAIQTPPRQLRVALTRKPWSGVPLDAKVSVALTRAAKLIEGLGHVVEDATPEFDYAPFLKAQITLWSVHVAQRVAEIARLTNRTPSPENLQHTTWALYERGRKLALPEYFMALSVYNQIARAVSQFFKRFDILLTPTCTMLPLPLDAHNIDAHGATAEDLFEHLAPIETFTALFNCTGQPAISLPILESSLGLPVGIQLVAGGGEDVSLLQLSAQLEAVSPWKSRRPRFHVANAFAFTRSPA